MAARGFCRVAEAVLSTLGCLCKLAFTRHALFLTMTGSTAAPSTPVGFVSVTEFLKSVDADRDAT